MKLLAQALVRLPFTLDFCAVGSEVPPIEWQSGDRQFTLRFPPSLTEGTCGKSVYASGWAWWSGERVVIEASLPIAPSGNDLEALRAEVLREMNEAVMRFLNSCRQRFHRPDIHPVPVDPAALSLALEHEDGQREALPEPADSFFYRSMPSDPPLESSVNETTIARLCSDLQSDHEVPLAEQLALDAEWLRSLGERERAEAIEEWVRSLAAPSRPEK